MYSLTKHASVSMQNFSKALSSQKFLAWQQTLDGNTRLEVTNIEILSVFMFGPNVGFITLVVSATNRTTRKPVPGFVFLRGDATAILTLIEDNITKELFMVLTEQDRVPIGTVAIETPAGMMDEEKNIKSVALKELKEETGLDYMTAKIPYEHLGDFFPSCGGCDEMIHCGYILFSMSTQEIESLQGRMTGEIDTYESIKLIVKRFSMANVLATRDAKLICSCMMFLHKKKIDLS